MPTTKHLEGRCAQCGRSVRFPAEHIGSTAPCPHCGRPTELLLAPPPADTSATRRMILWTVIGILAVALGTLIPMAALRHLQKRLKAQEKAKG